LQYSCHSFETVFDLSLFQYVALLFCRSFDTNPMDQATIYSIIILV